MSTTRPTRIHAAELSVHFVYFKVLLTGTAPHYGTAEHRKLESMALNKLKATFIVMFCLAQSSLVSASNIESSDGFGAFLKAWLKTNDDVSLNVDQETANAHVSETLRQIAKGTHPAQHQWHILEHLHQEHPRLIISVPDTATISDTIKKDKKAAHLFEKLTKRAEQMLDAPGPRYANSPEGALAEARLALKHITTFAAMYRLTNDTRYFQQAREEMLKISAFPDWGPANFLDVAEMTAAMGIGYDWLFHQLSAQDRQTIREAIVAKGLDPGLKQYQGDGWWRLANSNWNLVCNGGLSVGALAIAESEAERAEKIIACAAVSEPLALRSFKPDGGWSEGPMYWTYGTRYLCYFLSSLRSALGTDFNLGESAGLPETGFFRIYTESPTGKCFNFADSETEVGRGAQMFWLSREYQQPVFAGAELHVADNFPEMFHLLFFSKNHITPEAAGLPPNKLFRGINVACLRTGWEKKDQTYVGFKGGDNTSHHAHLDLGTFVFDAQGFRWAEDLGPDNYDLPGYFSNQRWHYYRTRTEGHNTLTSNYANQDAQAKAAIVSFSAAAKQPFAIADLTEGYRGIFSSVKRGVKLLGENDILIQDEIEAPNTAPLEWHLHTFADVQISKKGQQAQLTQRSKSQSATMYAEILAPTACAFAAKAATSSAPQIQQPGCTDLIVPLKLHPGTNRIAVRISRQKNLLEENLPSLQNWKTDSLTVR